MNISIDIVYCMNTTRYISDFLAFSVYCISTNAKDRTDIDYKTIATTFNPIYNGRVSNEDEKRVCSH